MGSDIPHNGITRIVQCDDLTSTYQLTGKGRASLFFPGNAACVHLWATVLAADSSSLNLSSLLFYFCFEGMAALPRSLSLKLDDDGQLESDALMCKASINTQGSTLAMHKKMGAYTSSYLLVSS
jgi:hypothetical protein